MLTNVNTTSTLNVTSGFSSSTSSNSASHAIEGLAGKIKSIGMSSTAILSTTSKPGLILVFGEQEINDKNTIYSLLGQQVPRIFSNKALYPALFLHESAKIDFEKSIQPISQIGKYEKLGSADADEAVGSAVGLVAKEQKNLTMIDINLNDFKKVYIHGHGAAGKDLICSGSSVLTAKELVDSLEKNGILNKIKDIRLTSCDSADKSPVESLTKEGIDKANNTPGVLSRLFYGKKESFLEKVANEIWGRGYHNIEVSGYHGKGVFYNGEIPMTHLRSTTIPAVDVVKREIVRKTLTLESEVD
ncbi:TPA: hypothetical protein ACXHW4_004824 [Enterobacter hormaechei]